MTSKLLPARHLCSRSFTTSLVHANAAKSHSISSSTSYETPYPSTASPLPSAASDAKKSARALTIAEREKLASMLRVNQAGELGANQIYRGQHWVLSRTDPSVKDTIQHMWDQEIHHLATFDKLIAKHRVRPTVMRPIWEVGAFVLGANTALMGTKAAMACTEAVETVIGTHYNDQLREIIKMAPDSEEIEGLKETIKQFRDDELEHLDTAVNDWDAKNAPAYPVLTEVIKGTCRAAIWVSERV